MITFFHANLCAPRTHALSAFLPQNHARFTTTPVLYVVGARGARQVAIAVQFLPDFDRSDHGRERFTASSERGRTLMRGNEGADSRGSK